MKKLRPIPRAKQADREMQMLDMWIDGKTYQEIATYFDITKSRVSKIVNQEAGIDYVCNAGSKVFVPCCHLSK